MEIEPIAVAGAVLLAQGFVEGAGANAWGEVSRMITVVRSKFAGDQAAQGTLSSVEESPTNEDLVRELATHISRTMRSDSEFMREIIALVEAAQTAHQILSEMNISNDFRNADIGKVVNIKTVHGDLSF